MKKKILIGTLLVILIYLLYKLNIFEKVKNIEDFKNWINNFGIVAPIVFIIIYALATVLFLPGTPFTLIGGIIFGPILGLVYVVLGASIGLSLAFLLARYFIRDTIYNKVKDNDTFQKIEEGVKKNGWRILLITRLVPIFPFNLQNYIYGLTNIKFVMYAILSSILIIPGSAVYVLSSGAIASGEGISKKNIILIAVAAIIFVILSFIPKLFVKKGEV
ncbi:putative membrane protein YdjX (TVP38/TMEM64 family) [Hypnocyclicus thermotrophus]|uniref:TVP38/TMEM64 family membrane protein n=1 Tax=Hypnocyclicus thermotrophus TaxID=1627895 RepID=A0AA46E130_9FUSO|nr:putative membrane protein YdjX (TVP38/TMEM64 family) [Hypnocyclicus thermotrophus]